MKRWITYIVLVMLATGCNTKSVKLSQYDDHYSFAMNVVRAAGITRGLKDMPSEQLAQFKLKQGSGVAIPAGLAVAKATGVIGVSPGLTNAQDNLFLAALLVPDRTLDARESRLLFWMPEQDYREQAAKLHSSLKGGIFFYVYGLWNEALIATAPDGYTITRKRAIEGRPWMNPTVFDKKGTDITELLVVPPRTTEPELVDSPTFITQPRSYVLDPTLIVSINKPGQLTNKGENRLHHTSLPYNSLEHYRAASRLLPEWMYVYIAPGMGSPIPLILHQGNVHYFEKPS